MQDKRTVKTPGITNQKLSALEKLAKQRQTGDRYQFDIEEEPQNQVDEEYDDEDDLKDFIECDLPDDIYGFFNLPINNFNQKEDYYEKEHRKRKYKKQKQEMMLEKQSELIESKDQGTLFKYMNKGKSKKTDLGIDKAQKANLELQTKDMMDDLFDEVYAAPKQQQPQYQQRQQQQQQQQQVEQKQSYQNKTEMAIEPTDNDQHQQIEESQNDGYQFTFKSKIERETEQFNIPSSQLVSQTPKEATPQFSAQKVKQDNESIKEVPKTAPRLTANVQTPISKQQQLPNPFENHSAQPQRTAQPLIVQDDIVQVKQPFNISDYITQPKNESDNQKLLMYWFDGYEDSQSHPGTVFLFGKIYSPSLQKFETLCIVIKNIERNMFVIPKDLDEVKQEGITMEQKDLELQLMQEIMQLRRGGKPWKMKYVSRRYAFEASLYNKNSTNIELRALKLKYSFEQPALLATTQAAKYYTGIIGTSYTALELCILKRKLFGPGWIEINQWSIPQRKYTWAQREIEVDNWKAIRCVPEDTRIPRFRVMSIAMKTQRDPITKQMEIQNIGITKITNFNLDAKSAKDCQKIEEVIARKPDNLPEALLQQQIRQAKVKGLLCKNEKGVIGALMSDILEFDPDFLVVHELYTKFFEGMFARIQRLNLNIVSRFGRLAKQISVPKNSQIFFKCRNVTGGRLLCDTYSSLREMVRESDYSLGFLGRKYAKQERKEFDTDLVTECLKTSNSFIEMLKHTIHDTTITLDIMIKMQVLPLTKELTNIAGNLWIRSLQNARAERNEMLLMHEFHRRKYIWPDKFYGRNQQQQEEGNELLMGEQPKQQKRKAAYGGGLVLAPKSGFYENLILLLDFNSLYPSIIQEYSICFTTVERKKYPLNELYSNKQKEEDEQEAHLPQKNTKGKMSGILPFILHSLTKRRREVKQQLKVEHNEDMKRLLDIKQKAVKLVANSMYGCLGFRSSRFYAKPIAALITGTGRQILQKTVEIVRDKLGYDIIYGDTDSVMIDSRIKENLSEALKVGGQVKKAINALYSHLVIDIDGVFQPLLLLKKKKYAAKKLENLPDILISLAKTPLWTTEIKGLDMVRRDWCELSKRISSFTLDMMLNRENNLNREEIVSKICDKLIQVRRQMENGDIQIREYLMVKQLTKKVSQYPDARNQPHVVVAKRLIEAGENEMNLVGNFIYYVVCETNSVFFQIFYILLRIQWQKKFFIQKSLKNKVYCNSIYFNLESLKIDLTYYKTQQIMPPLMRLCQFLESSCIQQFAECLGIDGSKYQNIDKDNDDLEDQMKQLGGDDEFQIVHDDISIKIPCVEKDCKFFRDYQKRYVLKCNQLFKNDGKYNLMCPSCNKDFKPAVVQNALWQEIESIGQKFSQCFVTCQSENCSISSQAFTSQARFHFELFKNNKRCISKQCSSKVICCYQEKRAYNNLVFLKRIFDYKAPKMYFIFRILMYQSENIIKTFHHNEVAIQEQCQPCLVQFFIQINFNLKDIINKLLDYNKISLKKIFFPITSRIKDQKAK